MLKDEEGNRRTVSLEQIKDEVAQAGAARLAQDGKSRKDANDDRDQGQYPYRPRRGRSRRGPGDSGRGDDA